MRLIAKLVSVSRRSLSEIGICILILQVFFAKFALWCLKTNGIPGEDAVSQIQGNNL